ncbi:hypothetical protein Tco_1216713 [Tanacetum coccineum]
MVAIDGADFDWSYMADEEVSTNLALMAFSDLEVHNTCSNTCLESFETLKTQLDNLRVEFNKSEFNLATYKRGSASVEEQLFFYKKNEVMLCDQIIVLKRDASFKDSKINALNIQIEKFKKEKESNQIKIDNFENASKSLDKLIGSQISNNNRKGVGYNAIPPPPIGLFAPPTIDLSNFGLKEFQQPEFKGHGFKANKGVCENSYNEIKKTTYAPIIEDWVSDCDEDESEVRILKSDNAQQKPNQANQLRNVSENPREVRPIWNNAMRVNHQNFSNSKRNFVPTAVLTKCSIVSAKGNKVTSAVGEQGINVVKSSACWVWRPKIKVAFLQKPTGSEEFHQIVDFLAGSHIRYALTTNPTIYVSFIEQFWQTATVKTVNDGEQQITVTVDGQTIAITEASVRRHL